MLTAARIVVALLAAYLLGAIPFALIIGKVGYKLDLREHGSGNLGATNVYRVLGWRAALLALFLDASKGAVAVGLAAWAFGFGVSSGDPVQDWLLIGALIAAVAGHSYSPYIGFCGGKGIATAAGGLLVMAPLALLILVLTFVLVVTLTKIVSLGSIIVAIEFPILVVLLYGDRKPILIMSFFASALVLWRHRSNIVRIFKGEEPRFAFNQAAQYSDEE